MSDFTRESSRDQEDAPTTVRSLSSVNEPLMQIDLLAACEQLRQEERWRTTGRNAMTVVKYRDLRIVLEVMRPGPRMEDGHSDAANALVLQVLSGRLRVELDGQGVELSAGRLLALDHRVPSEVRALEESAFLIWVSWAE
jgi:quercetin dioxygenase-like cupin family protein